MKKAYVPTIQLYQLEAVPLSMVSTKKGEAAVLAITPESFP